MFPLQLASGICAEVLVVHVEFPVKGRARLLQHSLLHWLDSGQKDKGDAIGMGRGA